MPITEDIMENEIIAPFYRRKFAQGRAEGLVEGLVEGQRKVLFSMIQKRFGRVTPAIRKRLAGLSSDDLTATSLRLLDAQRIDDLFVR